MFAGIAGDDIMKVYVNGEVVVPYVGYDRNPTIFIIELKARWNTVLVKCADYMGGWGYALQVANPNKKLRIARQPHQFR